MLLLGEQETLWGIMGSMLIASGVVTVNSSKSHACPGEDPIGSGPALPVSQYQPVSSRSPAAEQLQGSWIFPLRLPLPASHTPSSHQGQELSLAVRTAATPKESSIGASASAADSTAIGSSAVATSRASLQPENPFTSEAYLAFQDVQRHHAHSDEQQVGADLSEGHGEQTGGAGPQHSSSPTAHQPAESSDGADRGRKVHAMRRHMDKNVGAPLRDRESSWAGQWLFDRPDPGLSKALMRYHKLVKDEEACKY